MPIVKFAVVVGNDVAGTVSFDDSNNGETAQRFIAAYRSNPVMVETSNQDVMHGWTWDGTNFIEPQGA
jgi:hypothetical protein